MNRPRIAVIVSAVAASTAAFFITSKYHLAGTVTGAALFPVIMILVSHTSTQGVDAVHKWMRRRRGSDHDEALEAGGSEGAAARPAAAPGMAPAAPGAAPALVSKGPGGPSGAWARAFGRFSTQWLLAGLAGVAIAVSVYTLVAHGDPTVVRQTVIQKVTESAEAAGPTSSTAGATEATAGGTTATTSGAAATSTTTTVTTSTTATTAPASDTTTTSVAGGEPSTTDTTQASSTTLP